MLKSNDSDPVKISLIFSIINKYLFQSHNKIINKYFIFITQ